MRMRDPHLSEQLLFAALTLFSCLLASATDGLLLDSNDGSNNSGSNQGNTGSNSNAPEVGNHRSLEGSGITCWTCPNKTDNERCNDWAPDIECPLNHTVCMTIHRVNMQTGASEGVAKMCARDTACSWDIVGCYETATQNVMECISCCNYDYCNEPVPFNHTAALQLSASVVTSAAASTHRRLGAQIPTTTLLVLIVLLTTLYNTAYSHFYAQDCIVCVFLVCTYVVLLCASICTAGCTFLHQSVFKISLYSLSLMKSCIKDCTEASLLSSVGFCFNNNGIRHSLDKSVRDLCS